MEQVTQQIMSLVVAAATVVAWVWLSCKVMKLIPYVTCRMGLGEGIGLVVAVVALWPLFALTYQMVQFFIPS